jgi:hypothetical protein
MLCTSSYTYHCESRGHCPQYCTYMYLPVCTVRTVSSPMRQDARHEANWLRNLAYERLRTSTRRHPAWGSVTRDEEFGFSTLWLVDTPEIGDTTCGFYNPSMLSANMGARGCDGMCR